MLQDNIFKQFEGDNWFKRNQRDINRRDFLKDDPVLKIVSLFNIVPRAVLELGCANGYRLDYLRNAYKARCVGIDCSEMAVADGKRRFKGIKLFCGGLEKLKFRDGRFDLAIVNFVFHWTDRKILPLVMREADRVLKNHGLIIIADFFPLYPKKIPYHHISNYKVYTYKDDYAAMFKRLGCYQSIGRISGECGTKKICVQLKYDFRLKADLLLKEDLLRK